jgi:hypothetical protein
MSAAPSPEPDVPGVRIAGRARAGGDVQPLVDPSTGRAARRLAGATAHDLDEAVAAAAEAHGSRGGGGTIDGGPATAGSDPAHADPAHAHLDRTR